MRVASMATCVTPSSFNQSTSSRRSPVKVPNTRVCWCLFFSFASADADAHGLLVHIQSCATGIHHVHVSPSWTVSRRSLLSRESPSRARYHRQQRQFVVPPGSRVRLLCGHATPLIRNDLRLDTIHNPSLPLRAAH